MEEEAAPSSSFFNTDSVIFLSIVFGFLALFIGGNYYLWWQAQKLSPPVKRKPLSKKKKLKELRKQGGVVVK